MTVLERATCKNCLQVHHAAQGRLGHTETVKEYLTVRHVAEGEMTDMAAVKYFFTTQSVRDVLENPGTVNQAIAKSFAESEFEKYRIVQDRLFESDFDKMAKRLERGE